jgi:hypothetical protein
MNNSSKTRLTLDDDVGYTHLAAEGRKEDNKLDRINIVCDGDESCLLGFNKGNDMVQAVFGI